MELHLHDGASFDRDGLDSPASAVHSRCHRAPRGASPHRSSLDIARAVSEVRRELAKLLHQHFAGSPEPVRHGAS